MRLAACLLFLTALLAQADTLIKWKESPEPDIAGYRVHVGTRSGVYTRTIDAKCKLAIVIPESEGVVAVTAYDLDGLESDYSAEVAFKPRVIRWQLPAGSVHIESSIDLTGPVWLTWATFYGPGVFEIPVNHFEPQRFFRYTVE